VPDKRPKSGTRFQEGCNDRNSKKFTAKPSRTGHRDPGFQENGGRAPVLIEGVEHLARTIAARNGGSTASGRPKLARIHFGDGLGRKE